MPIGALIVDDQEDIRLLLRLLIEHANQGIFVCGEAASGREALEQIDELDPAVVVLDHMMPQMTGIETAKQISARRPDQPMILFSAFLDERVRRAAVDAGIAHCLGKDKIGELPGTLRAAAAV